MNKRAKFAVFGIILSIIIAMVIILPFMSKADAQITYNNNYASTPSEIKNKIPVSVAKDDNWQVEWHETYVGLTHREYIIAIQNQKDTSNEFALSVLFDSMNFDASQLKNANLLEWKEVSKEIPVYGTIESCDYPSIYNNETGKATGNSTNCWNERVQKGTDTTTEMDWVKVKDLTPSLETKDSKKENYDNVVIDGKQAGAEKSVRYFKLGFDVPIVKLSDGSFGSQGRVAFIEENSGKEYHPVWMTNYTYYYNGTIQSNAASTVTNLTHIINGSAGWYGNVIWCRNPAFLNNTMNGNFTFYENSATDYRYVNASDNRELSCEVEKGAALNRTNGQGSAWDDSLTARWGVTNTMDSIGTRHLTLGNGVLNSSGLIGGSLSVIERDGATFADIDASLNTTTIMGWFRKYETANDQKLLGKIYGANTEIALIYYGSISNKWSCDLYTTTDHLIYSYVPAIANVWTHVACRYDGNTLTIFVNGTRITSTNFTGTMKDANQDWLWAGELAGDGYNYTGDADEARVYTGRNLSDDEIRAIYETQQYNYTMLGVRKSTAETNQPEIRGISISPAVAYTNSILNCSGTYIGTENGKVDITWYNGSVFYGINSKIDVSNGSMVSSVPYGIQNMQDGFDTDAFGSDHPLAITTNGSDFWIGDLNDGFVYHVNRTGSDMGDGFSAASEGIATNGSDFWINNGSDIKHVNRFGNDLGDGFKLGFFNSLGITTNGTDFWVINTDNEMIYHNKPNGTGGATNYPDSFSTLGFGSGVPYDLTIRGSDLWIYDLKTPGGGGGGGGDGFIYHVRPDGVGGVINYSDGINVSSMNQPRAITSWPVSYNTSNQEAISDFWITDTNSYLVAHKKRVVADVAKGETWNCTMQASNSAGTGNPNSTTRTISNTPPLIGAVGISNFNNCSAIGYDLDLDSLTLNFTWYNGSAYYSSATRATSNGTMASYSLPSGTQKGGETWNCSVFANDGTNNSALNSTSVLVGYNITFDVRSGEDNSSLTNFNIYCNNSWSVTGVDSPYSKFFAPGSYECEFEKPLTQPPQYYNKTITFNAEGDKTVYVIMSKQFYLTTQEHNWLSDIYDCLYNGNCKALDLLEKINQTTTQIWQQVTLTNRNVVTQEQFISSTLNSSSNITVNYTIQIPFKQGYANGELLPLRMYFWFTDINKTQCYNQDKSTDSNRAQSPYCFPLVAETLGPNNGSVTFTVDLRPNLTAGNYNITRAIEIDPLLGGEQVWTNYGQEDIGQVRVEESPNEPAINLVKTGETKSAITSPISSITGAAIQEIKSLLTSKDMLVLAGMLTFVISLIIISITFYKAKKLEYSK